jgi:hypothetical protein
MAKQERVLVRLRNSLSVDQLVILEPLAAEHVLGPGKTIDVVVEGDLSLPLEFEVKDNMLILYAFDSEGGSMRLLKP